jgi:hypothetical protein
VNTKPRRRHAPERGRSYGHAWDDERTRTEPVEERADDRSDHAHQHAAGQQHEPGLERGEPEDLLQIDRQQDQRAEHGSHRHDDEHHGE